MNGVGLNRYFRLMKEWQEQNPGKKVGVSAQHKIIETMTKYSPENKYQERQTAALEKIADQIATIIAKLIKDEEREKQSQAGR